MTGIRPKNHSIYAAATIAEGKSAADKSAAPRNSARTQKPGYRPPDSKKGSKGVSPGYPKNPKALSDGIPRSDSDPRSDKLRNMVTGYERFIRSQEFILSQEEERIRLEEERIRLEETDLYPLEITLSHIKLAVSKLRMIVPRAEEVKGHLAGILRDLGIQNNFGPQKYDSWSNGTQERLKEITDLEEAIDKAQSIKDPYVRAANLTVKIDAYEKALSDAKVFLLAYRTSHGLLDAVRALESEPVGRKSEK